MKWIEYRGEVHTLVEWAKITGLNAGTIYTRRKRGCPIDKLFLPLSEMEKQRRKRPARKTYEINGETRTIKEWADHWGLTETGVYSRMRRIKKKREAPPTKPQKTECICWHCIHSWLDYDKGRGCSWSYNLEMMEGVEYETQKCSYGELTIITSCPKFEKRGGRRQ